MFPRFACCLSVLLSGFFPGFLHGEEESYQPDPGRFRTPLIRAWFPSTLVGDYEQFEEALQREMNAEAADDSRPEVNPVAQAEQKPRIEREGVLIYYDPNPSKRKLTPYEFYHVSQTQNFPGWPWFKPVRFLKIGSREEFLQELENRTAIETLLSQQTLEQQGDGYALKQKDPDQTVWVAPPPHGYHSIGYPRLGTNLFSYLKKTSRYWAYRDGYMFFGDFEEILTMDLPDARQLELRGADAERDVFLHVDLDAVVPKQKRVLWELIRKQAERSLQQRDEEGAVEYALRKSIGDLQLNLIQAITQDLDSIRLGIDFGSEARPVRSELELVARPRVNLEHYFGRSGRGIPELAELIDEPSAMTFATSWGLPERMVDSFDKLFRVINTKLAERQTWNFETILAAEDLSRDLLETVRDANHVVLKLQQTKMGFTLFGGVRLNNAARISANLKLILNGLTVANGWGVQQSRDASGRTYFSFRPAEFSESFAGEQREQLPAEMHFTVIGSILWFSVGRQNSLEVLAQSLDRIDADEDRPARTSIPLALFDISLDRLLPDQKWPETNGFDRLPLTALEELDAMIPGRRTPLYTNWVDVSETNLSTALREIRIAQTTSPERNQEQPLDLQKIIAPDPPEPTVRQTEIGEADNNSSNTSDYTLYTGAQFLDFALSMFDPEELKKFLKPDQSGIRLQFDADEKRVRVRATVSLGVIKHVMSRMIRSSATDGVSDIERFLFIQDASPSIERGIRYLQTNPVQNANP